MVCLDPHALQQKEIISRICNSVNNLAEVMEQINWWVIHILLPSHFIAFHYCNWSILFSELEKAQAHRETVDLTHFVFTGYQKRVNSLQNLTNSVKPS